MSGNDQDPHFRDIADHLGAILWISDPDGERRVGPALDGLRRRVPGDPARRRTVHVNDVGRRLESAPGRGTSVACAFPLGLAVAAVTREAAAPHAAGETVLVAEDEPLVRTLVAGALREQGYMVLEAGELAIADATPGLALLVTDVVMPSMDGRELTARLRDAVPGIPVLFVSGYTDGALSEDGEPATAFLPKPFMSAELMAAVRTLLDPELSPA